MIFKRDFKQVSYLMRFSALFICLFFAMLLESKDVLDGDISIGNFTSRGIASGVASISNGNVLSLSDGVYSTG